MTELVQGTAEYEEPEGIRHLHKTDDLAYCGIDISYVLATFDPTEATCKDCLTTYGQEHGSQ